MTALAWILAGAVWLLVDLVLVMWWNGRDRVRRLRPIPPLPGLNLAAPSLGLLQAWTRVPDDVTIDEWAEVHAEVARLMPSLAQQLDRLEDLRVQTSRAAAAVRGQAGEPYVPAQASWTARQHAEHDWRRVAGMPGIHRCFGCGELRGGLT